MSGSSGPPGGSDDSDSEEDPHPQGHGRDPATSPRPRNPPAATDPFAPGDQCIPGRDRSRILAPIDYEPLGVDRRFVPAPSDSAWLALSTSGFRESSPVQIQ
ncbi:unnamed protein product [Phytophthora fragariaefolia]|uniref:Unnamed protein product n=1 Tax=Phytophthora fragariaefolia TaxID=1490495 RepID=A0A9W6WPN2_9STRA|nr:unnamed protein product [Phytophthora fragariaefolia]